MHELWADVYKDFMQQSASNLSAMMYSNQEVTQDKMLRLYLIGCLTNEEKRCQETNLEGWLTSIR